MAEEANPNAGASEADPNAAGAADAGTAGDGGAGAKTAEATGEALAAAEREAIREAARREFQSERDRDRVAREKAERELSALKGSAASEGDDKPLTQATLAQFLDARDRVRDMRSAAASLRNSEDFSQADKSIFDRADEFDSPEALRAAAEVSHKSNKAERDKAVEAEVQARLEAAAKEQGFALKPAPTTNPPAPSGDPTIEQLHAMPMSEFDKVPQDVVDRVLAAASTVT